MTHLKFTQKEIEKIEEHVITLNSIFTYATINDLINTYSCLIKNAIKRGDSNANIKKYLVWLEGCELALERRR